MKKTIITFTILIALIWVGLVSYFGYLLKNPQQPAVNQPTVSAPGVPKQPTLEESRVELFGGLNKARSAASVPSVVLSEELNTAAQDKCEDLIKVGKFAHDGNGKPIEYFIKQNYQSEFWGENLFVGESYKISEVTEEWINSPEHYENMVDPVFTKVGFGVCTYTHGHYTDEDSDFDLNGLTLYVEAFAS